MLWWIKATKKKQSTMAMAMCKDTDRRASTESAFVFSAGDCGMIVSVPSAVSVSVSVSDIPICCLCHVNIDRCPCWIRSTDLGIVCSSRYPAVFFPFRLSSFATSQRKGKRKGARKREQVDTAVISSLPDQCCLRVLRRRQWPGRRPLASCPPHLLPANWLCPCPWAMRCQSVNKPTKNEKEREKLIKGNKKTPLSNF